MQPPIQDLDVLDAPAPVSSAPDVRGSDQPHALAARAGTNGRSVWIETYGCQMNVADSELVASILGGDGYALAADEGDADVVLLNTCAIREKAEDRIRRRLIHLRARKERRQPGLQIGVLGCMAERLRSKLLEQERLVDLVVGPDAYRDLPRLLSENHDSRPGRRQRPAQ